MCDDAERSRLRCTALPSAVDGHEESGWVVFDNGSTIPASDLSRSIEDTRTLERAAAKTVITDKVQIRHSAGRAATLYTIVHT